MRKEVTTVLLAALTLGCLLVFVLGLALAGGWGVSPEYQRAMESLRLDTEAKMRWIQIAFWGGLATLTLVGVGGLVGGVLRTAWRRSRLIQPNASGLFPVVENRAGGQTYYHDPNRQWMGTTVYGAGPEGASVRHVAPAGQEEVQFQIASQAQATQFIAAASQGRGLTASARRLAERVALSASTRPVPHLPEVVVLDESMPEERRLLAALCQDWVEEVEEAEGGL
jgi:hypothetical protein